MLTYAGYGITYKGPEKFKKFALIAGIPYALIEGLRWLRGQDYAHYYNDLVTVCATTDLNRMIGLRHYTDEPELLYDLWTNVFHMSGLPFWVAFVLYSALLIYAFLKVLKLFPQTAVYALPIFLILTVNSSENVIRQFLAFPFLFLAYYFYEQRRPWVTLIMLAIVPMIHYSGLVAEAAFVGGVVMTRIKPLLKFTTSNLFLIIVLGLYTFTYFFWDSGLFQHFADFLYNYVDLGDEKAAGYVENADRWFTEDGSISNVLYGTAAGGISIANESAKFLTFAIILWLGFYAAREDNRLIIAYFYTVGAVILMNIAGDIELFRRFYLWFVPFLPVIAGAAIDRFKRFDLVVRWCLAVPMVLYFLYYNFVRSFTGTLLNGYAFIWDANVPLF